MYGYMCACPYLFVNSSRLLLLLAIQSASTLFELLTLASSKQSYVEPINENEPSKRAKLL